MALDFTNNNDWDFDVIETPVSELGSDTPIEGWKLLKRADNGKRLNMCRSSYTVLPNAAVVQTMEDAIKKADISNDYNFKITSLDDGRKFSCEIIWPDATVAPNVGDITSFRVRAFNSYDGTLPFSESADGLRLICKNGQVMPHAIAGQVSRHTKNIDVAGVADRIVKGFEMFQNQREVWALMTQTKIDVPETIEFFKTHLVQQPTLATRDPFNRKQLASLASILDTEVYTLGRNKWAAYNAMTAWATHVGETASPAITTRNREEKIARAMRSSAWRQLEAA
jgi:hypothetical protein